MNETPLDEVMAKPLSKDIINQMAEDTTDERKDLLIMAVQVNEMQASLIARMFKTLKVEAYYMDPDEFVGEDES